jgi:hypothetical protein
LVLGPPGTGKTTWLLGVIEKMLEEGVPPSKIAFLTFTKKAASEAKERAAKRFSFGPDDLVWFRTIHSLVFRQLGLNKAQVVKQSDFGELGKMLGVEFEGKSSLDEEGVVTGAAKGDKMVFLENLARATGRGLKRVWEEQDHGLGHDANRGVSFEELSAFARAYAKFKGARGLIDYTDMLETFVKQRSTPRVDALIVDEAQDLSHAQWAAVEVVAAAAKVVHVAGDDDQCSLADSLVETTLGPMKAIELDPQHHKLICWDRDGENKLAGFCDGYRFKKQVTALWSGDVVTIEAGGQRTRVTWNHHCFARWSSVAKTKFVTYLMRQGVRWRVGWCQLFRADGAMHLNVRARAEKADGVWILDAFDSKAEAYAAEAVVAAHHGIPTITFEPVNNATNLTRETIDRVFNALGEDLQRRAHELLSDRRMSPQYPLWSPNTAQRFGSLTFVTRACNLSPLMLTPVRSGKREIEWLKTRTQVQFESGIKIVSLDVEKHHNYVVDGIVTHNCIFRWAGADVEQFMRLEGQTRVLDQSYRIPAAVHEIAEQLTGRIAARRPKRFKPRDERGLVDHATTVDDVDMSTGSWLLLARHVYQLDAYERVCREQGWSYEIKGRSFANSANIRTIMAWEALRRGEKVQVSAAVGAYKKIRAGVAAAGRLALSRRDSDELVSLADLRDQFGLATAAIWHEAFDAMPYSEKDFYVRARRQGERLTGDPRIRISTIHGAKGGQADNVVLGLDISEMADAGMRRNPDDETRVFYVGATRAKERLVAIQPRTRMFFEL